MRLCSPVTLYLPPLYVIPLNFASVQNTNQVEYVLQLGALAIIPYVAEMVLEHGIIRGILKLLHQVSIQHTQPREAKA